jgi:AraC-like DNA-binding protein/ligand-binding sensor protein
VIKTSELVRQLARSEIYRDYEKAFSDATGLPLSLRGREIWHHALQDHKNGNPFCVLMAASNRSCAACLQVQQKLTKAAAKNTATISCFAGLCDTAVPLKIGDELAGFLQTGQVALRKPSAAGFSRVTRQLLKWGTEVDLGKLEESYFHSKVLSRSQYEAMIRLLEIFAGHLSTVANQILTQTNREEPGMIIRAKSHVRENLEGDLSLAHMAKILNVSTFHFCKTFHKNTGLTFTEYLTRTRLERACNLLNNPNLRISEVAFNCGFGSLGHFNRVFKRVIGCAPGEYRRRFLQA